MVTHELSPLSMLSHHAQKVSIILMFYRYLTLLFVFYRTGNSAKLSVEYFDQNKIKQSIANDRPLAQDLRNPKIILNKDSDLVVGGVPTKMKLPSQVDAVNYTGCFDGLQVNHHFVGSWNSDVGHETML